MAEFPEPHLPLSPGDPHWVIKRDLAHIIERYTALGDQETADEYQDILSKYTGEHPTKLF
ncbi:hypothetical protein SAMN04487914_10867 [Arthrobacter sp. ok909]|uniref:hypothetical protein n=1 Tax=Arthrobacter sp. ok909 TaxID=1761746 RepID=UPI00087EA1FE|nr:hypothetical protein [Arthrobacter sp. ok909]SDP32808.1 hypothetical protein SAMN04487914_10867 [Arthrobacter sp. ok909]